jgi:DNA-binding transcriptional regulator GbsR (MarR family)
MLEWEHFNEPSVVTVFLALLLNADKDGKTNISLGGLSSTTGLTKNTIRTALTKLVESGEITRNFVKGQRTTTIITNWKEYQVGQKLIHKDNEGVSKNDTQVGQKLIHTVSKNDPHYKNNKNIQENIVVADAHARTHEEFIADALNALRVEQGCMAMRISPDEYRQLVNEVINDWEYRQLPENEWTLTHLLAQMRIKHNINNRNNGNQRTNNNGNAADTSPDAFARYFAAKELERRAAQGTGNVS